MQAAPQPLIFDTVVLGTSYNNAGPVLGSGPTGPVAGDLAGTAGSLTIRPFDGPVSQGSSLSTGPSAPLTGFASGSGFITMVSPAIPFALVGPPTNIYSIDFVATMSGTSFVVAAAALPEVPAIGLTEIPDPIFDPGTTVLPPNSHGFGNRRGSGNTTTRRAATTWLRHFGSWCRKMAEKTSTEPYLTCL